MSLLRVLIGTRAVFRQSELSSGFRRGKGKEEADERVNGRQQCKRKARAKLLALRVYKAKRAGLTGAYLLFEYLPRKNTLRCAVGQVKPVPLQEEATCIFTGLFEALQGPLSMTSADDCS